MAGRRTFRILARLSELSWRANNIAFGTPQGKPIIGYFLILFKYRFCLVPHHPSVRAVVIRTRCLPSGKTQDICVENGANKMSGWNVRIPIPNIKCHNAVDSHHRRLDILPTANTAPLKWLRTIVEYGTLLGLCAVWMAWKLKNCVAVQWWKGECLWINYIWSCCLLDRASSW